MNRLFEWAFSKPTPKIGFEDVVQCIQSPEKYAIINTLPLQHQSCLIAGTLDTKEEEAFINGLLTKYMPTTKHIVLYGLHACDETPYQKQRQLISLGITEVWVYSGGLFEWLLLQDIYGETEFPTTSEAKKNDMLRFRPTKVLQK
jgi:hypothetical protein